MYMFHLTVNYATILIHYILNNYLLDNVLNNYNYGNLHTMSFGLNINDNNKPVVQYFYLLY